MTTRRVVSLLLALCALAVPTAAYAGPVNDFLRADRLPPVGQATVRVVPPRGGSVMLYRDGKVAGFFMRPGFANVEAGQPYGVMAMRGTFQVFHAGILVHPGLTELVWEDGANAPTIGYLPPPRIPATRVHAVGHSQGRTRGYAHHSSARSSSPGLVRQLRSQPNDSRRLSALKRHLMRERLSSKDAAAALRTFQSKSYRDAAARMIRKS